MKNDGRNRVVITKPGVVSFPLISQNPSLRAQGKDNPFTLELSYNYKIEITDASGNYVGASSAYFDPTGLAGWSALKTLFKEYKLVKYGMFIRSLHGRDQSGLMSVRKTNDPAETVFGNLDLELENGADEYSFSELTKGIFIPADPDTQGESEWRLVDETTDANNFGYNKEYGQIFVRAQNTGIVSNNLFSFHEFARVVFRGYKTN